MLFLSQHNLWDFNNLSLTGSIVLLQVCPLCTCDSRGIREACACVHVGVLQFCNPIGYCKAITLIRLALKAAAVCY